MRAPGLVDDQRHAARVGDLGQRGDVGAGAEVGRRDDHRRDRLGGFVQRRRQRVGRQPVGDPQLGVELGGDEGRPHAAEDEAVDHRGVDVALDDDPVAAVGERHAGRVVALRGAVDQEPGAARAPGLGGELLRLLEGGRFGADVDPLGDRGDVVAQADLADQLEHRRVGAEAALVPGDLEAAGVELRVGEQGVDVRSGLLTVSWHRVRVYGSGSWRLDKFAADLWTDPTIRLLENPGMRAHATWLLDRGGGGGRAAPAAERRPRGRRPGRRRRLHGDVDRLVREAARARGAGRPARVRAGLRARAERPQRRLLQRDVVLARLDARALGRRAGAGDGAGGRAGGGADRRLLRGARGRRLVPAAPATCRSRRRRRTTASWERAVRACRELGVPEMLQPLSAEPRSPSAATRRPSAPAPSRRPRRRCSRRAWRSVCASSCWRRGSRSTSPRRCARSARPATGSRRRPRRLGPRRARRAGDRQRRQERHGPLRGRLTVASSHIVLTEPVPDVIERDRLDQRRLHHRLARPAPLLPHHPRRPHRLRLGRRPDRDGGADPAAAPRSTPP